MSQSGLSRLKPLEGAGCGRQAVAAHHRRGVALGDNPHGGNFMLRRPLGEGPAEVVAVDHGPRRRRSLAAAADGGRGPPPRLHPPAGAPPPPPPPAVAPPLRLPTHPRLHCRHCDRQATAADRPSEACRRFAGRALSHMPFKRTALCLGQPALFWSRPAFLRLCMPCVRLGLHRLGPGGAPGASGTRGTAR